jgi:hypothetical protein
MARRRAPRDPILGRFIALPSSSMTGTDTTPKKSESYRAGNSL